MIGSMDGRFKHSTAPRRLGEQDTVERLVDTVRAEQLSEPVQLLSGTKILADNMRALETGLVGRLVQRIDQVLDIRWRRNGLNGCHQIVSSGALSSFTPVRPASRMA